MLVFWFVKPIVLIFTEGWSQQNEGTKDISQCFTVCGAKKQNKKRITQIKFLTYNPPPSFRFQMSDEQGLF